MVEKRDDACIENFGPEFVSHIVLSGRLTRERNRSCRNAAVHQRTLNAHAVSSLHADGDVHVAYDGLTTG